MRRSALLLPLLAACADISRTPYGKYVIETHAYNRGSSCLSDSHSHLYGPDGRRQLEPLTLWETSGDRHWALAAGPDPRTLHLLDLDAGKVHDRIDRGEPAAEPWKPRYAPFEWTPDRGHLLLKQLVAPDTESLLLISFLPDLRIRPLFREAGFRASVHELRRTFWAPDGSGLAFLVSPGPLRGPTRLFHVRFDGAAPQETDRVDGAPNTVAVDWDRQPPKLR